MIKEQYEMHHLYDFYLSLSDISSKFIALDTCHYYKKFLSLGFPRNDILFLDHSSLRKKIESIVNFKVKHIITYVPTHRDYENPTREFYKRECSTIRSIWGNISEKETKAFEESLINTGTLIIAKVHPLQQAQADIISKDNCEHVILYNDLTKKIQTSLNPLLAVSDCIITDYTSTVYDFLLLNRPIIYYFYDIEKYRNSRGFFIEPIESICAGKIVYTISELKSAIEAFTNGDDPAQEKRKFLQQLFIKHHDGNSAKRIIDFFFTNNTYRPIKKERSTMTIKTESFSWLHYMHKKEL